MIKIDKNQRKRLQEVCEDFDENAIGDSILVSRVREHRIRQIEVPVKVEPGEKKRTEWKAISLPEDENDPNVANTPVHCGVVLDIAANHATGLKRGDLVRFSPLSAESITSSDGSYTFLRIDQYVLRTVSHNIFTAEDEMFCEPPPPDVLVN